MVDMMKSASVPAHRGLVHWQGLLLAVSLLTFWSPPTAAQLAVEPTSAIEGRNVFLRIRNMPPDAEKVFWYRGENVNYNRFIASAMWQIKQYRRGPANSGRESVNMEGSMWIRDVTLRDAGMYTAVIYLRDRSSRTVSGRLRVCRICGSGEKRLFQNHRNLTIRPIKKEDAGDDQCQVADPSVLLKVCPLEMDVKYE